ncbi:hypothetical protein RND71_035319 [Anisodus tanguticus]|uniref:Uncharacterized protein n=1 Tax=Anisodus tanguticus TaxID=243964 RepID=A0AAE1UUD2_9SOLA|nr:hypothetical protein RND71_035319 [Anisodus tanguticus]
MGNSTAKELAGLGAKSRAGMLQCGFVPRQAFERVNLVALIRWTQADTDHGCTSRDLPGGGVLKDRSHHPQEPSTSTCAGISDMEAQEGEQIDKLVEANKPELQKKITAIAYAQVTCETQP